MGASPSKLRVENVSDTSVVVEMDWGNGATSAVEVGPRAAEVRAAALTMPATWMLLITHNLLVFRLSQGPRPDDRGLPEW